MSAEKLEQLFFSDLKKGYNIYVIAMKPVENKGLELVINRGILEDVSNEYGYAKGNLRRTRSPEFFSYDSTGSSMGISTDNKEKYLENNQLYMVFDGNVANTLYLRITRVKENLQAEQDK